MSEDTGPNKVDNEEKLNALKAEIADIQEKNEKLRKTVRKQQDMIEEQDFKIDRKMDNLRHDMKESYINDMSVIRESIVKAIENAEDDCNIKQGLRSTVDKMDSIMSDREIRIIDPQKENKFNPELHEAIKTTTNGNHESGKIVDVKRPGYMYDGSVIQYAKVIIEE